MNKILLTFLLISACFITHASEQTETEAIIQKCIDMPEFQEFFPRDHNGNFIPVHIMQYPMRFEQGLAIKKFGAPPVLMSREEIYDNNVDAYFLFEKVENSGREGWARFTFYHDFSSENKHGMHLYVELLKENDKWVIQQSEIQKF